MQVIPFKPSYYELWMVAWDASSKVKISSANPFEDPQGESLKILMAFTLPN
jgi:hypothetical protein